MKTHLFLQHVLSASSNLDTVKYINPDVICHVQYTSTNMYGMHTRVQKHTCACTELQLQYVAQGQRNYVR